MKKVYLAVLLLAVCILLCAFEQYTVENTYKTTTQYIDTACTYAENENFEEAEKICSKLTAYWDKKYPYLSAMIDHGMLDEAGATIYSLEEIAHNKGDELTDELITAENQIKIIREN
ncbi:MAG: DUF4363 family protein [Clostridiales bacterium]|nr:DUF4363 family protein [Clostridiales bacterium]